MVEGVWTAERTEQLKKLWANGLSCVDIAAELGCFSHCQDRGRNAIFGKLHRLKLRQPTSVKLIPKKKPKRAGPLKPLPRRNPSHSILEKIAIAAAEPGLPECLKGDMPDGTGIKLRELTGHNCHWPVGDPKTPDFEFCGARAVPSLPYCVGHCRLAYQPPDRRDRVDRALFST